MNTLPNTAMHLVQMHLVQDFGGQDLGPRMGMDGTSEPDHIRALDKKRDASSMESGHAIDRDLLDHGVTDQDPVLLRQRKQDQLALPPSPTLWPRDSGIAETQSCRVMSRSPASLSNRRARLLRLAHCLRVSRPAQLSSSIFPETREAP